MNFINKLKKDVSVRTNVDYAYRQTQYDLSDSKLYFDGIKDVNIAQTSNPHTKLHVASITNEYKFNSNERYIDNDLKGEIIFLTNHLPVSTTPSTIHQTQKINKFNIHDHFSLSWNRRAWRYTIDGVLEIMSSPKSKLNISEKLKETNPITDTSPMLFLQTARSTSFTGYASFSVMRKIGNSRLYMPLDIFYMIDKLHTDLFSADSELLSQSYNKLSGKTLDWRFSPTFDLSTPYNRFTLHFAFPLTFKRMDFCNSGIYSASKIRSKFLTSPNVMINYTLSSKSTITFNGSYTQKIGDVLDFMTSPVMTDYMSAHYGSGILSKEDNIGFNFFYDFKLPLSLWFLNAQINYNRSTANLEPVQNISEGLIVTAKVLRPNSSRTLSTRGTITKNIRPIKTKISFSGNFQHTDNSITQNNLPVKYSGIITGLQLTLTSKPIGWIEVNYQGNFSNTSTRYLDRTRSFNSYDHDIDISFYPKDNLQIKFSADITDREIEAGDYKFSNLFDISASYRYKKIKFDLSLNNIFNCRSYSYTLFSGLDRFSFDYTLRERLLVGKISFTL